MTRELERARAALASEPRLDLHKFPIELSYADGTLTLEGEVGDIAAKKLALERAAALPEVTGIIDRLGLPPELGGTPLDKIGATGFGLAVCAETAQDAAGIRLQGARVVVQGFGSVGRHAARFLAEKGAVLVAASDTAGAVIDLDGIDVEELIAIKDEGGQVSDYAKGRKAEHDAVIDAECEIWIPAARPDVIRAGNVDRLRTKLVLQGANIPVTPDAETRLHARGILAVPDFIANAGGVICAAVEYRGGTQAAAFDAIAEKIRSNTAQVLDEAAQDRIPPRQAAMNLALRRVRAAMRYRRWS